MGTKSDLEIIGLIGRKMGIAMTPWTPDEVAKEMQSRLKPALQPAGLIEPSGDTMFTSGTLGRYCTMINSTMEAPGALYKP